MNSTVKLEVHIKDTERMLRSFDADPDKVISDYLRAISGIGNIVECSSKKIGENGDVKYEPVNVNEEKVVNATKKVYIKTQPYSYHNFFFPFLWATNSKKANRKNFAMCLSEHWKPDILSPDKISDANFIENYNTYHYFNQAAQNAIYSNKQKDDVVWNYRYDASSGTDKSWLESQKSFDNQAQYVITVRCPNSDDEGEEYALKINGIRLKLFNTGVGILIFELENYNYARTADINKINDFGRRVYPPFCAGINLASGNKDENASDVSLRPKQMECSLSADKISLTYGDKINISGNLKKKSDDFRETTLIYPIQQLFTKGKYTVTTSKRQASKTTFYIEPIIDDRMFTACYYINGTLIEGMRKWCDGDYAYVCEATDKPLGQENSDNKKKSPENYNFASILYELVYVDGDGITCHSRKLLKEMLNKKHIYDRWLESGSITGISEYSMITVTNSTEEYLANIFLTEYVELMVLALAQRASLLNFERRISNCALNKGNIRNIHNSFILFQSQLLLLEVTPQQQGIELYQMLLDNMFIKEQTECLEKQVTSLFTQKTFKNEVSENFILFCIALLSVAEPLWLVAKAFLPHWSTWIRFGVVSVLFFLFIFVYIISRKK